MPSVLSHGRLKHGALLVKGMEGEPVAGSEDSKPTAVISEKKSFAAVSAAEADLAVYLTQRRVWSQ